MNGGEIIAKVLQNHGVKFLFTLCGGHISPIFVSAENLGIRVIDTRHEVNAVFAADAVSRLTGIPGVAAVTAGPGLTNTITAVKNAMMAQSPLILLGGGAATILKGRGSLQDIDQMSLMKPNVKWAARITKVKDIIPTLEKAFAVAQEGIPGPVFVECPIDTLYGEELVREWYGAKSKEEPARNFKEKVIQWYINRHARILFEGKNDSKFNSPKSFSFPTHSASDINNVISKLKKAKNPILLVGSGSVMLPKQAKELAEAVEKLGIPVYLSGMGRGLLGKESNLQLRHKRKEAIKKSDLIILAGVPNDFRLDYGNHIGHRSFISINRSREDLNKNKRPTVGIIADPQSFLIDLAKKYSGNNTEWVQSLKANDAKREANIDEQANEEMSSGMNPVKLFRELDKVLDDNIILVADGGDFVATSAYTLKARAPLSWLDPGVFGTLGVGAGFALGAKLVFPEKEVWIIYGDGSAGYSLVEYDTFVRHKIPVISLIGNDACWSQIARDQIEFLKSDCAVTLEYSNYEKIGEAFGAQGKRVEDLPSFLEVVKEAREKSKNGIPYIINAVIGKSDFRKGSISM